MTLKNPEGNMNQLQQGDVIIEKIRALPHGAKKLSPTALGIVLAEGETHNHHHVITEVKKAAAYELNGQLFVEVAEPVTITHEEHGPIELLPGVYEIGRVQEQDHLANITRPVND